MKPSNVGREKICFFLCCFWPGYSCVSVCVCFGGGRGGTLPDSCDILFHFIFVPFSFLFARFCCVKMVSTTISTDALQKMWAEFMFHPLMCGGEAHTRGSKDIPALHNVTPGLGLGVMTRLPCGGSNVAQHEHKALRRRRRRTHHKLCHALVPYSPTHYWEQA